MVYPNRVVLNINQKYVMPIPYTQQGDTARVLTFNILDKGVPFNLTGKTVRAKILKPDNTKCYNDLTITNATNGECTLKLTNQILAVAGNVNCQLEIKEGEELLSTIIFPIDVEPSIDINGAAESTNEFTALLNGIIKLDEWDKYFKEASGKIEEKYTERLNGIDSSLEESKSEINLNKNDIISIFAELLEKATKEELEVLNTRIGEIIAQAGDGTIPSELVDIRTGLSGTVYASSGNAVRAIASGREIQENVLEHKHMKINYLYGFVDKVIEINTTNKTVFIPNAITVFYHSYYRNPLNMNTTINYSNLDATKPIYLVLDLNSKNIICVEKQYNNKDYVLIAVIYGTQIKTFDITKFKVNGIVNGGYGDSIKETQLTFNYRVGQALITSGDRFIIDTNLKTLKLPKTMYVLSLNKFSSPLNVNTTIDFSDLDTNYPLFIYYNFNDRNIKVVVRNTYDKDNCLIGILQQNKILNCFRTQDFIVNDVTNGGWGNETSNGGLKDNLFVTAYGDSITYGGVWFSNLLGRYNLRGLNMGWSNTRISYVNETNYINPDGTHNIIPSNTVPPNTKPEEAIEVPASFCSPERIAYIPSDSNFVLIAGGTNDFLYNVPLGTFDGANTTFKGALMSTYKQVVERCANAEVIFITPPPIPQDIDNGEPRTNSLGLKVIDYRNAIIEFCELYGIKYIDVYVGANIPCMYPSKYFKDRVHPSTVGEDSGQIRMYHYIAKEFEPCLLMKGI